MVHPATGVEGLRRTRRVLPRHRRLQHGCQGLVLGAQEVVAHPLQQQVLVGDLQFLELRGRDVGIAIVQLGHQLQIGDEGTQLGRGAHVQLRAAVDVEGLIQVVRLHPQHGTVLGILVEGEAVDRAGQVVAGREQQVPVEARGLDHHRIGQASQEIGNRALRGGMQGDVGLQVDAVEVIEALNAQVAGKFHAQGARGLVFCVAAARRAFAAVALERDLFPQGEVAKGGGDDVGRGQQPEIGVGVGVQVVASDEEVVRRLALRDQQAQHVLERARCFRCLAGLHQQVVCLGEIDPEPGLQSFGDAVHFSETRGRGERHGVEIVQDDAAPRGAGVLAVEVGAQRGRGHLGELVGRRHGQTIGRMAVFLDLRGQSGAARHVAGGVHGLNRFFHHRFGQAIPFHGGVALRMIGVEQLTVFDEQQGVGDDRRDGVEVRIGISREPRFVDRLVAAIEQGKAGDRFLLVGQVQPVVEDVGHVWRDARLGGDLESFRLQSAHVSRQVRIAIADVVGAEFRYAQGRIFAGLGLERQALAVSGEQHGLEGRGDQFIGGEYGADDQQ